MADGDQARLFHRLTEHAPERPGTGWPLREVEDPRLVTSFRSSDLDLLPPWVKVYEDGLPARAAPARAARARARDDRGTRRPARSARCARPSAARAAPPPLGGRRPHRGAGELARRVDPLPRRRVGGRTVPARGLCRRPGGDGRSSGRGALVPAGRARAPSGRPAACGRDAGARRHRRALADRLEVPRARLPARVLGRGDDALAGARARRERSTAGAALHRLPRRRAGRPRRGGRDRRVPRCRCRARRRRVRAGRRPSAARRGRSAIRPSSSRS